MAKHTVTEFLSVFTDRTAKFADAETDLLILLDSNGCFEYVYAGFTRALGYTETGIHGQAIIDFIDPDTLAMFIKSFGWYSHPYPPFKMLHRGGGLVTVRMEWFEFTRDNCWLILRPLP